jgi:RimK family alpha-L-glutamate ligase
MIKMKLGLLTRNQDAWCSTRLVKAIEKRSVEPVCLKFPDFIARIACKPEVTIKDNINVLEGLSAIIVRPIGKGSLDEIIFRLDLLHRMERLGLTIVNQPSAIEKAVDKYYTLTLLEESGIPVPRTVVVENSKLALNAFNELGGDVVVKPIFGSRGIGITRVSDFEIANRIFRSLSFNHNVLYIQEFVPHGNRDIRAFVVGDKVIASMYRVAGAWKTNVSQGATPKSFIPDGEIEKLAIGAAKVIGCEIAGVDIMEGPNGYVINEINSQPGFRGLQSTVKTNIAEAIVDYVIRKVSH